MTPLQAELHQAHKARQARMAAAAERHAWNAKARFVQATPVAVPAKLPIRRVYETKKRLPNYMPLATRVLKSVSEEFGMTVEELIGQRRTNRYCIARFVVVGILSEMTQMSLPAMGRRLGGRDHTTILHAQRQAKKLFATEAFRNRVDQIKSEIAA